MLKAKLGKEIVIETDNEIGVLRGITNAIASKGVSIQAISAWDQGRRVYIHLVTDDNLRAKESLTGRPVTIQEKDVVLMELPHKPGMLRRITDCLSPLGINIDHVYASSPLNAETCLLIFSCDANQQAVVELNRLPQAYAMMAD